MKKINLFCRKKGKAFLLMNTELTVMQGDWSLMCRGYFSSSGFENSEAIERKIKYDGLNYSFFGGKHEDIVQELKVLITVNPPTGL